MLNRFSSPKSWLPALLLLLASLPARPALVEGEDPLAGLHRALRQAEAALAEGEPQIAESRYREALLEGWLLLGGAAVLEGDLEGARTAFAHASNAAVETRRAEVSLALVELRLGESEAAVRRLTGVLAADPRRVEVRRLLAQALAAAGQPGAAVEELEEAREMAPDDPELAFTLATGRLRLGQVEAAEELFAEIARARPIPETWVLIGRTWRDFGDYGRSRSALMTALEMDPEVRRAHYYLGTLELLDEGRAHLAEAIAHFEAELRLAPNDALAGLYLGMALVESRRFQEAVPVLEAASRTEAPHPDALHFLGRCYRELGRPEAASEAFAKALDRAGKVPLADNQLSSLHYQLALTLRELGREDEAAFHFEEAKRYTSRLAETSRERLTRYLEGKIEEEETAPLAFPPPPPAVLLAGLPEEERRQLVQGVTEALARAWLNLGILQVQRGRFARGAEHFEQAALLAPDFPRLQYSLGVAYFNAGSYERAVGPLGRALEEHPGDGTVRRMLALAEIETEDYAGAAALLADDPGRGGDRSLQYAYALALVRSGRAAEAGPVFDRLLREQADWPELAVLVGQAQAQQGDFTAAVATLEQALELDPGVAEAHATLGNLYLRQGELGKAEEALRAELAAHPENLPSRYLLATVLDLDQRPEEAEPLLRSLLAARPAHSGGRYLLGKILLRRGEAAAAAEQLEAAAALAPEDANVHYQLGQAYQRLGRGEAAQRQFERFRRLKAGERGER